MFLRAPTRQLVTRQPCPLCPQCARTYHTRLSAIPRALVRVPWRPLGPSKVRSRAPLKQAPMGETTVVGRALVDSGFGHLISKPKPQKLQLKWRRSQSQLADLEFNSAWFEPGTAKERPLVLQKLTADCIRNIRQGYTDANIAVQSPLTPVEELSHQPNILKWARALTEPDPVKAAQFLRVRGDDKQNVIPIFVISTFLRRPYLPAAIFRDILTRVWNDWRICADSEDATQAAKLAPALFPLLTKLLRHARRVWPESISSIGALFSQSIEAHIRTLRKVTTVQLNTTKWTVQAYNTILHLISRGCAVRPFASAASQERAQFEVLRSMTQFNPPITLSRTGFRALIAVQMMRTRTEQELDWENLKSSSWPPWKVEKTGLDAEKDFHYGKSRAFTILEKARLAGYADHLREHTAQVLTGWDLDLTPTIQQRLSVLRQPRRQVGVEPQTTILNGNGIDIQKVDDGTELWVARIIVRRTRREAWACFLEYKDSVKNSHEAVYNEMLSKLLSRTMSSSSNQVLAGGDKEIRSEPTSPKEVTYTPTDPPTPEDFAQIMLSKNMRLSVSNADRLAMTTDNFEMAISWLLTSTNSAQSFHNFLRHAPQIASTSQRPVNFDLIVSLFRVLCKFPNAKRPTLLLSFRLWKPWETSIEVAIKILNLALGDPRRLLAILGKCMEDHRGHILHLDGPSSTSRALGRYLKFRSVADRVLSEQSDNFMPDFGYVVLPLQTQAILEALSIQKTVSGVSITLKNQADELLRTVTPRMLQLFYQTASETDEAARTIAPLPRLLATPQASSIHSMVRSLGMLRCYRELLDLFAFLKKHEEDIGAFADLAANGRRQLQLAAICARVFFERAWLDSGVQTANLENKAASNITVRTSATWAQYQELHELMTSCTLFSDDWPSDLDVAAYIQQGFYPDE